MGASVVEARPVGDGTLNPLNYLYKPGLSGGQTAFGGIANGESLTLQGADAPNRGFVNINGSINYDFNWNTDAGAVAINWQTVIASSGGALTSFLNVSPDIVVDNGLFILSALDDNSSLRWTVTPGFSVATLFFARPTYRSTTAGIAPAQAFIYAAQAQYQLTGAGDVTTPNYRGFSFAPIVRVDNSGDDMRFTNTDGLTVGPLYNTRNVNSTADYGSIRGVHMLNASTVLFGQALGSEIATNWIGLDCQALTGLTVSGRRAAVRSAITAAATNRFIENTGGAESDFGAGSIHFNDLAGVRYGGVGITTPDWQEGWGAAGFKFEQQLTGAGGQMRKSFPAAGRMLMDWSADTELNINTILGFSLGAQTGANGNTFGNFVTAARTIGVSGEWADFLLTQGGNLTVDGNNMSRVSSWVINAISYASSTGTVTNADTLTVGGFPTSSPGVTITNRQSLHVIAGRTRLESALQLGTITPANLAAGDNNNYAGLLTGSANNGMRTRARLTGNATTSVITGFDTTAMQDGDTFILTNIGTETIVLSHQDTASSVGNRIEVPNEQNYLLRSGQSVHIWYDDTTGVVRIEEYQSKQGALGGTWQYDNTTAQADPGSGNFRTDNNTVGSVTEVYLNEITKEGVDASGVVTSLVSGDQLYIFNQEDAGEYLVFDITANNDQGGWAELQGTVNDSGANFTDGKEFGIIIIKA